MVRGFPVVDGVFINGKGPYRFLLDTGATTNRIDEGLARELGLMPTYRVEMVTPNGRSEVPGGRVSRVSIGGVGARNLEMIWTLRGFSKALGSGVKGTIGQDFLSRFKYMLDLENRELVFDPAADGERIPFERVENRNAIFVPGLGRMVLDSGASSVFLFERANHFAGSPFTVNLLTSSGETRVAVGGMKTIRIGGQEIKRVPALVVPRADLAPGKEEDGLLPLRLFRAVYVNNIEGYVVLNPRRNLD